MLVNPKEESFQQGELCGFRANRGLTLLAPGQSHEATSKPPISCLISYHQLSSIFTSLKFKAGNITVPV